MKGIMIIGFSEEYEAFIDAQYPKNLAKKIKFKDTDIMDLYTLHKMERVEPNFIKTTIKNQMIASFYTGSNFNLFVGLPDYTVSIVLTDEDLIEDILPKDFEGMIRRIAHLILPKRDNNPDYHEMVNNFFMMLKNGDLEPFWDEYNEKTLARLLGEPPTEKDITNEIIVNETTYDKIDVLDEIPSEENLPEEVISEKELFEEFLEATKENIEEVSEIGLGEETEDLKDIIEDSPEEKVIADEEAVNEDIVDDVTMGFEVSSDEEIVVEEETELEGDIGEKLDESVSKEHYTELEVEVLKQEIEEVKSELKEKTEKVRELSKRLTEYQTDRASIEDIKEENIIYQESIKNLSEEKESQAQKINELIQESEDKDIQIADLEKEIENHIDRIADLKIELRDLKNKDKKAKDDIADKLIDMKKEIKVLRRECDHYKKIIKDNDLL